jgi:hypothetical protein
MNNLPGAGIAPCEALPGKSLTDQDAADFIVSNNCSSTVKFQLCSDAGVALLIDSNQIIADSEFLPTCEGKSFISKPHSE